MYKSKMIEMLRHFGPRDFSRFGDYLASPYFNKDVKLQHFYAWLRKAAPSFTAARIDKQRILARGIPGLVLNEKKLGYLMSDMVRHIESYIRLSKDDDTSTEAWCRLLSTYNAWENDKLFDQALREAQRMLDAFPWRYAPYFYKEFLLESEINAYFDRQKKRAYDESLQKASDYLDLFYLATKLKFSCELINRQKLVNADYRVRLLGEITSHLRENSYAEYPSVTIYYQILMTFLGNEDIAHFTQLKRLLDEHSLKFPPEEARDMYAYAQNYCIRKINAGRQEFLSEYLQLSKAALQKNLLLVDGYISPWTFKNIVSVACRTGEIPWAEQFIKNYRSQLNAKFRTNAFHYNQAYVLFSKKQYGDALKMLNQVEFTDIFYALDGRTMQIKIYYELDEPDPLQSAIDAFRVYLRRNKTLSENVKRLYSNFLKFAARLSRIPSGDNTRLAALGKQVEETRNVADIRWLQQKTEEKTQ